MQKSSLAEVLAEAVAERVAGAELTNERRHRQSSYRGSLGLESKEKCQASQVSWT